VVILCYIVYPRVSVVLFTLELVLYTISGELGERVADILDVVAPVAAETLVVKVTGEGGARRVR
jgi:hypothetical protein